MSSISAQGHFMAHCGRSSDKKKRKKPVGPFLCGEKEEIKHTEHYLNNIKAMIQENKRQEV